VAKQGGLGEAQRRGRGGRGQGGRTPTGVRLGASALSQPLRRRCALVAGEARAGQGQVAFGASHLASTPPPLIMHARHNPHHGRHTHPPGGSKETGRRQEEAERAGRAGSQGRQGPCPLQSKSSRDGGGATKEEIIKGPLASHPAGGGALARGVRCVSSPCAISPQIEMSCDMSLDMCDTLYHTVNNTPTVSLSSPPSTVQDSVAR